MADPVLVLKRFREEGCSVRLLHPQRCVQHDLSLASKWCCEGGVLCAPAAPQWCVQHDLSLASKWCCEGGVLGAPAALPVVRAALQAIGRPCCNAWPGDWAHVPVALTY